MTVTVTVARHVACFRKSSRACSANYHNNFDEREPSNPRNKLAAWKPHVANTGLLVSRHATPKTFQVYTKLFSCKLAQRLALFEQIYSKIRTGKYSECKQGCEAGDMFTPTISR